MVLDRPIFADAVKTPFGTFQVVVTDKGLARVHFPGHHTLIPKQKSIPRHTQKPLESSKRYLKAFFKGCERSSNKVQVDWNIFQPFDRRILRALTRVPLGTTISYSALARRAGNPKAARAVGNALRHNPIPIVIPCHRVIRKDGSLGGYALGLIWKRKLLELERSAMTTAVSKGKN